MLAGKRTRCLVCNNLLYREPSFVIKNFPRGGAQELNEEPESSGFTIDKKLYQCSGCGLVQCVDEPVPYYKDNTRAGERSRSLIKLRERQYRHFIESYHLQGKKIIEIGAGKGGFLRTLKNMKEFNVQEYGLENNSAFVDFGIKHEGVNMIQGFIDQEDFVIPGAPFDAFISFAYLQRLDCPNLVMRGIYNNLIDNGVGFVQVPALEHILRGCGFYDIVNDHLSYWNLDTLRFFIQRNGFEIEEIGEVESVYNYAIVRKRKRLCNLMED